MLTGGSAFGLDAASGVATFQAGIDGPALESALRARGCAVSVLRGDADPPDGRPDESGEEEDFARMLEESLEARSVEEGQTVEGVLVSLTQDAAFIDVGGKGEATMDPAGILNPGRLYGWL